MESEENEKNENNIVNKEFDLSEIEKKLSEYDEILKKSEINDEYFQQKKNNFNQDQNYESNNYQNNNYPNNNYPNNVKRFYCNKPKKSKAPIIIIIAIIIIIVGLGGLNFLMLGVRNATSIRENFIIGFASDTNSDNDFMSRKYVDIEPDLHSNSNEIISYYNIDEVSSICIDVENADVKFNINYHSDDNATIRIKYQSDNANVVYTETLKNEEIQLREKSDKILDIKNEQSTIEVLLPESFKFDNVKFSGINGGFSYVMSLISEDIDIRTVSGPININKIEATNVNINSVSGEIVVYNGVKAEGFNINTVNGHIDLTGIEVDNIDLEMIKADCYIRLKNFQNLGISSVSGYIDLTVPKDYDYNLSIDSLSAKVDNQTTVNEKSDNTIKINSVSGNIVIK